MEQVTKREVKGGWKNWKWRSSKDKFLNGAFFVQSGYGSCAPLYSRSQSFPVADGSMVPALTAGAGQLGCTISKAYSCKSFKELATDEEILKAVEFTDASYVKPSLESAKGTLTIVAVALPMTRHGKSALTVTKKANQAADVDIQKARWPMDAQHKL
ncbi:hypothetical protein RJ640_005651 [Escallonia rubra]|uniref:Uncharacterized protein n=1 Tax=Escallonia rubra TaxID=112253 RepID=A0AA88UPC5_9ASTE|nr:hypothetical protein RJ640_005651 [Escallonia rubra]